MKNLSENFDYLRVSLPLLKEFRYGDCCEYARMKSMSIAINDLFTDLDINIATRKQIKEDPVQYYNKLRKIILEDENLSDSDKLQLYSLM